MEDSTRRDLDKLQDEYDLNEDLRDSILEQLVEHSNQEVEYNGEPYFFEEFHYDGVMLEGMTEKYSAVFVGKYWLHKIKIL